MTRRRSHTLILASAFGFAVVAVPALPAVAGDSGPTVTKDGSTYTLKVLETDSGDGDTYIPKGGEPTTEEPDGPPKAGDGFGFSAVLTQDGTKVGTDGGTCTFESIDPEAEIGTSLCRVTLKFANGTITVEDTVTFSDDSDVFKIAIVSGTGDYAGATGTLTVHDLSSDDEDESDDGPSQSELTAVYTLSGSQVAEVPTGGAAAGGGLGGGSDTALLIGIGAIAGLAGLGVVTGGRVLASRRD